MDLRKDKHKRPLTLKEIYKPHINSTFEELSNPITNYGVNTVDIDVPHNIAKLLGFGMKCALPPKLDLVKYIEEIDRFQRLLHLNNMYASKEKDTKPYVKPKFYVKSSFNPYTILPSYINNYIKTIKKEITDIIPTVKHTRSTLTRDESTQLKNYATQNNIIIQNADKGLGLTVMSRTWYDKKGENIVKDYKYIEYNLANTLINSLFKAMKNIGVKALRENTITLNDYKYLFETFSEDIKFPLLYLMPKLHKTPVGVRPIVADHSSIFAPAARYIGEHFKYIYKDSNIIISDTRSLITQLEQLILPPKYIIATADITNLYGEIPLNHLQQILEKANVLLDNNIGNINLIDNTHHKFMTSLSRIVLNNNYLQFNNKIYIQNKGVAMGSALGPTMANIYLHDKIDSHLPTLPGVLFVRRYLDDVLFILEDNTDILQLQNQLNKLNHPYMNFTIESSNIHANFLDLDIMAQEGKVILKNYVKPVNKFLYLPFISFHTQQVKRGFIITELKRLIKNSSTESFFNESAAMFAHNLLARGYPIQYILEAATGIRYNTRTQMLNSPSKQVQTLNNKKMFYYVSHLDHSTRANVLQGILRKHAPILNNKDGIGIFREHITIALTKSPTLYNLVTKNKANLMIILSDTNKAKVKPK